MLTQEDKALLAKKGISEQQIQEQLACFEQGFPYLQLAAAAAVDMAGTLCAIGVSMPLIISMLKLIGGMT